MNITASHRLNELLTEATTARDGATALVARIKERTGFLRNQDSAISAEALEADPEIAAYQVRLNERLEARRVYSHVARQAELFLAKNEVEDVEAPEQDHSTRTGSDIQRELMMLRGQIEQVKATREGVDRSVPSLPEVEASLRASVAEMVEHARVKFALDEQPSGNLFDEAVRRNHASRYDILSIMAFFGRESFEAHYAQAAKERRKKEGRKVLNSAARAKQLEALDAELETMERRDVELTRRAEEWGTKILPRLDTSPAALLGVRAKGKRLSIAHIVAPVVAA